MHCTRTARPFIFVAAVARLPRCVNMNGTIPVDLFITSNLQTQPD